MAKNPFKPTAGKMPPILIGRQPILEDFEEALENGAGAPGRFMLITGQPGSGKTVLLTAVRKIAQGQGWLTFSETASQGLCERLSFALKEKNPIHTDLSIEPSLTVAGMTASLGKASLNKSKSESVSFFNALVDSVRSIRPGKGVLVTIDEIQAAGKEDLEILATSVQRIIALQDDDELPDDQKKGVALVMAGLPSIIDEVLQNKVLTFLRRSMQEKLGDVMIAEVRDSYLTSVEESGKHIDPDSALEAATLSEGYPYMIQLIGYYMWRSAEMRNSNNITALDILKAKDDALMAYDNAVCAPVFVGLKGAQQTFVMAMADDYPSLSKVSDITRRTGKSSSWVSKYRRSLIDEQVITSAGQGKVSFVIPHFGRYMKAHFGSSEDFRE